ncbi:hypothetical protein [Paraburkholderia bryophila]|uniref:Uncharacterized protein n=1 Tax=Paraburkholderia bryophila TaxID=420952 RepID=A0A7Z0BAW9_9BURK|nr:hypothetical protein [Paraburkholderia bryophila]NYH27829.1 hypothetical protein [Paraburkholderia bryophila]
MDQIDAQNRESDNSDPQHGKYGATANVWDISPETRQRNKPSGTHYVEPSPLGIEPVEQTGVDKATNPPRSTEHPAQTAEVPLGTGAQSEPPGGGGRESQRKE